MNTPRHLTYIFNPVPNRVNTKIQIFTLSVIMRLQVIKVINLKQIDSSSKKRILLPLLIFCTDFLKIQNDMKLFTIIKTFNSKQKQLLTYVHNILYWYGCKNLLEHLPLTKIIVGIQYSIHFPFSWQQLCKRIQIFRCLWDDNNQHH